MYAKKNQTFLVKIQTKFRHYLDEFRYQNLDKIQTPPEKFRQIQYVF